MVVSGRLTAVAAFLIVTTAGLFVGLQAGSSPSTITIHTEMGDQVLTIEIADTPERRSQGLMYRGELPDRSGMLFIYAISTETAFWMKNTYIPLDMVWISETGNIIGITHNVPPMTLAPRPSPGPVKYVLEIEGGTSESLGIKVGNSVTLPASERFFAARAATAYR